MVGDLEEIPELVRVFCLGRHKPEDHTQEHYCNSNGFDYRAATELLRRDPDQVRYATYECETRRDRANTTQRNGGDVVDVVVRRNNTFGSKDINNHDHNDTPSICQNGNPFLYSPLRWACIETTKEAEAMEFLETIRSIDPTHFLLQDSNGDLPIDGECVLNASLELLSFLLEIYLDYDFVCPNGVGMTEPNFNPITCLCGSYWEEDIHQAHQEILSGTRIVFGTNVLEDNLGIEDNFWKKIILLAKAFYHKTIDDVDNDNHDDQEILKTQHHKGATMTPGNKNNKSSSSSCSMLRITNEYADRRVEFLLLHACAGIDWFPPNLLRLLVAAFPGALLESDEDGNLPIHVASGGYFESYKIDDDDAANSGYQKTTLDILLEANPDLAKIPDGKGRLPLELAIESSEHEIHDEATKQQQQQSQHGQHNMWRPWVDGGICSLLKAYPEAARIRSPVSVKLPLEITLGRGSYRDWNDGVEALLKAYPEAAGLKNPYTGKYPLQLAIERETHFDDGVYGLIEVSPEVALVTSFAVVSGGETQARKTSNNDNSNSNSNSNTTVHEMMPLFALAALENCSASVVYKILRMNPESCRLFFEKTTTTTNRRHNNNCKRKQNQLHREHMEKGRTTTSSSSSYSSSGDPPVSNKRLKPLSYATAAVPQKAC
jgi:hypothetical protein